MPRRRANSRRRVRVMGGDDMKNSLISGRQGWSSLLEYVYLADVRPMEHG